MPFCGESGQEKSAIEPEVLPLNFQTLQLVCKEAGILGDFYSMIQDRDKYDFRAAFNAVVQLIEHQTGMSKEIIEKGFRENFDLYLDEDEPIGPEHRLW